MGRLKFWLFELLKDKQVGKESKNTDTKSGL